MAREKALKCVARDFNLLSKALQTDKAKVPQLLQVELIENRNIRTEKAEDDNSLFHWSLVVVPPEGSIYGGPHPTKPGEIVTYVMQWKFNPDRHPHEPPEIVFRTPIFHPLVDDTDGKLCEGVLNNDDWKPTTSPIDILNKVIQKVFQEYSGAVADMPSNASAAKMLSGGKESEEFAVAVEKKKALVK